MRAFRAAFDRMRALGRDRTERAGTLLNDWGLLLMFLGRPLDAERAFTQAVEISQADASGASVSPMLLLERGAAGARAWPRRRSHRDDRPRHRRGAARRRRGGADTGAAAAGRRLPAARRPGSLGRPVRRGGAAGCASGCRPATARSPRSPCSGATSRWPAGAMPKRSGWRARRWRRRRHPRRAAISSVRRSSGAPRSSWHRATANAALADARRAVDVERQTIAGRSAVQPPGPHVRDAWRGRAGRRPADETRGPRCQSAARHLEATLGPGHRDTRRAHELLAAIR